MKYLSYKQLIDMYPYANRGVIYMLSLPSIYERYNVTTTSRYLHFLSQFAHESGNYKYLREIISPERAERLYGAGTKVGRILGNKIPRNTHFKEPGDGFKYIGRGICQLTGRWNYGSYSKPMGLDLIEHPELLEFPEYGVRIGFEYWKRRDLNKLADHDNLKGITLRINGGYNGLESRLLEYKRISKYYKRVQ